MKKYLIILAALLVTLTGCKQEAETSIAPSMESKMAAPVEVIKTNKGATAVGNSVKTEVKPNNNSSLVNQNNEKVSSGHKTVTEENLAETIAHARKRTKSEESKSRSRAEIAEEEMLKDLEKFK